MNADRERNKDPYKLSRLEAFARMCIQPLTDLTPFLSAVHNLMHDTPVVQTGECVFIKSKNYCFDSAQNAQRACELIQLYYEGVPDPPRIDCEG